MQGQQQLAQQADRLAKQFNEAAESLKSDPLNSQEDAKRGEQAQAKMKQICTQCHTPALIDRVYKQAEQVVEFTNSRVRSAQDLVNGLRKDGTLSGPPFSHPIDFVYFDLWHYDGRTSKHGAFMGGADFVQWHGNYPMLNKIVELRAMADDLRRKR